MLADDQPADSHHYNTFACANNRDLYSQSVFFIHRTRVVAHRRSHPLVFRFAQRVAHTPSTDAGISPASTDDALSRVPRAASSTHVAKHDPSQLIRQLLLGECTKRLKGLTLAYRA